MLQSLRIVLCWCLIGSGTLFITGCSSTKPEEVPDPWQHAFAVPAELEPQVDFWRKVYSHWSLRQVVLHDDRHMPLIYTTLQVPMPANYHYGKEQRAYVRSHRKALEARLAKLEEKVSQRQILTPAEQQLLDHITATTGQFAIYGAADRLRAQRGQKERFRRGLEVSGRYLPWFRQVFSEVGLPDDLALLPHVESSFQPSARSSAGAVGMWQFTRGAARVFMTNHPALDERLDPVASARGAARYLSTAYDKLGTWPLALTSYNHGIHGMRRAKEQFGTDFVKIVEQYKGKYFKFASRNFYAEFLAAREIARDPERFFSQGITPELPLNWEYVVLTQSLPVETLSERYRVGQATLIAMNPAWTSAALRGRVDLPYGTQVWLPPGTLARLGEIPQTSLISESHEQLYGQNHYE